MYENVNKGEMHQLQWTPQDAIIIGIITYIEWEHFTSSKLA